MPDYPYTLAIPSGDPRWRVYAYTLIDTPGVVAANNFVSFFNPSSSGKIMLAIQGIVSTYAAAVTTSTNSMGTYGISSATGGTLVAASAVPKLFSPWPNASTEVRIGGPAVTVTTSALGAFPPVMSTGTGSVAASSLSSPSPTGVPFLPGEGFVFRTLAGDADQVWNITFIWAEVGIDSVEG